MHQHGCIRMLFFNTANAISLELFVHDAGAIPDQDISSRSPLDVITQVAIRCEQDLFTFFVQVRNHVFGDAGGDYPVGTGLDRR